MHALLLARPHRVLHVMLNLLEHRHGFKNRAPRPKPESLSKPAARELRGNPSRPSWPAVGPSPQAQSIIYSATIATTRAGAALAPTIRSGKQATLKPVGGSWSRPTSRSICE